MGRLGRVRFGIEPLQVSPQVRQIIVVNFSPTYSAFLIVFFVFFIFFKPSHSATGDMYPLVVKLGTITPHGADVWYVDILMLDK